MIFKKANPLTHFCRTCLLVIVLFATLSSCAQRAEKSKAKFKVLMASVSDIYAYFPGGILIYGKESGTGESFSFRPTATNNIIPLTLGVWKFWAVGWTGANNFEGSTRCAVTTSTINSPTAVVDLSLSQSGCLTNNDFAPSSYMSATQFKPLQIANCNTLGSVSSGSSNCTGSIGPFLSYRVSLPQFKGFHSNLNFSSALTSACIEDAQLSSGLTSTSLNLPVGSAALINLLVTRIEAFSDSNCTTLSHSFQFSSGIANPADGTTVSSEFASISFPSDSTSSLFLKSPAPAPAPDLSNIGLTYISNAQLITSSSYQISATIGKQIAKQVASSANYNFHFGEGGNEDKKRTLNSSNYRLILNH